MRTEAVKRWLLPAVVGLVGLVSGVDIVAGMKAGTSLANVKMLPSLGALLGAAGYGGVRWLNGRTVRTKRLLDGLPEDAEQAHEALYRLAACPDVSDEMATDLADIAAECLKGYHRRCREQHNGVIETRTADPMEKIQASLAQLQAGLARQQADRSPASSPSKGGEA